MPRNPIKMLTFGGGAILFAGLFGLSLASYAESGSFAFYKQQPYASRDFAQSAPFAEPASYPISPPSLPVASAAEMTAVPRASYSPGYPGNVWPEDARAAPAQPVSYERIGRDESRDTRVIPETGGSWAEPAREPGVIRPGAEEAAFAETAAEDSDAIEEPLAETD